MLGSKTLGQKAISVSLVYFSKYSWKISIPTRSRGDPKYMRDLSCMGCSLYTITKHDSENRGTKIPVNSPSFMWQFSRHIRVDSRICSRRCCTSGCIWLRSHRVSAHRTVCRIRCNRRTCQGLPAPTERKQRELRRQQRRKRSPLSKLSASWRKPCFTAMNCDRHWEGVFPE